MSLGESCKSCRLGTLRPFQLSATEAIVKCSNTDCDGYLDFRPRDSLLPTVSAAGKRRLRKGKGSSNSSTSVSSCSSPQLDYSPAQSLISITDQEVAHLNAATAAIQHCSKPALFASSYQSLATGAQPAPARLPPHKLETLPSFDIYSASPDEVDRFLDSITEQGPPPPTNIGIPSQCSAFSHVEYTDNAVWNNDQQSMQITHQDLPNTSSSSGRKPCSQVGLLSKSNIATSNDRDHIMLDENQFLSPASSAVSEDSGYNDEIASAVAVSEAGTRGGQATTKTTNCMLPTSSHKLHSNLKPTTADTQSVMSQSQASPHSSYILHSSHDVTSSSLPSSTDNSISPDNTAIPLSLLLPKQSCTNQISSLSSKDDEDELETASLESGNMQPCPTLSFTKFISIYEQNLVPSDTSESSFTVQSCGSEDSSIRENEIISQSKKSEKYIDIIQESLKHLKSSLKLSESSSECFTEKGLCGNDSTFVNAKSGGKGTKPHLLVSYSRNGRPPKRKYKKRSKDEINALPKENIKDTVAPENILLQGSFTGAAQDNNQLRKRKKKTSNESDGALRKSARKQTSGGLSVDCSDGRSSSSLNHNNSLANLRPSLAALLPPILPQHSINKHSCHTSRSNKRLKPSQPFRHMASNAFVDPWAFPGILLDELHIEVVVRGRRPSSTTQTTSNQQENNQIEQKTRLKISDAGIEIKKCEITESCSDRQNDASVQKTNLKSSDAAMATRDLKITASCTAQHLTHNCKSPKSETSSNFCMTKTEKSEDAVISRVIASKPQQCSDVELDRRRNSETLMAPALQTLISDGINSINNCAEIKAVTSMGSSSSVSNSNNGETSVCIASTKVHSRAYSRLSSAHQPVVTVAPLDYNAHLATKPSYSSSHGNVCKFTRDILLQHQQDEMFAPLKHNQFQQSHTLDLANFGPGKFIHNDVTFQKNRQENVLSDQPMPEVNDISKLISISQPHEQSLLPRSVPLMIHQPGSATSIHSLPIDPNSVEQGIIHDQLVHHKQIVIVNQNQFCSVLQPQSQQQFALPDQLLQYPSASLAQSTQHPHVQQITNQTLCPQIQVQLPQVQYSQVIQQGSDVRLPPNVLGVSPVQSVSLPFMSLQQQTTHQSSVFCQAGPHKLPLTMPSSPSSSHSCKSSSCCSGRTALPGTSVGQRDLPQLNLTASVSVTNCHTEMKSANDITSRTICGADHTISNNEICAQGHGISNKRSHNCPYDTSEKNDDFINSDQSTFTSFGRSSKSELSAKICCLTKALPNSTSIVHDNSVVVSVSLTSTSVSCTVRDTENYLASSPTSPESCQSSPENFPFVGSSPDYYAISCGSGAASPNTGSSEQPPRHLSTSPCAFPSDSSPVQKPLFTELFPSTVRFCSPSSLHLILSDEDGEEDSCACPAPSKDNQQLKPALQASRNLLLDAIEGVSTLNYINTTYERELLSKLVSNSPKNCLSPAELDANCSVSIKSSRASDALSKSLSTLQASSVIFSWTNITSPIKLSSQSSPLGSLSSYPIANGSNISVLRSSQNKTPSSACCPKILSHPQEEEILGYNVDNFPINSGENKPDVTNSKSTIGEAFVADNNKHNEFHSNLNNLKCCRSIGDFEKCHSKHFPENSDRCNLSTSLGRSILLSISKGSVNINDSSNGLNKLPKNIKLKAAESATVRSSSTKPSILDLGESHLLDQSVVQTSKVISSEPAPIVYTHTESLEAGNSIKLTHMFSVQAKDETISLSETMDIFTKDNCTYSFESLTTTTDPTVNSVSALAKSIPITPYISRKRKKQLKVYAHSKGSSNSSINKIKGNGMNVYEGACPVPAADKHQLIQQRLDTTTAEADIQKAPASGGSTFQLRTARIENYSKKTSLLRSLRICKDPGALTKQIQAPFSHQAMQGKPVNCNVYVNSGSCPSSLADCNALKLSVPNVYSKCKHNLYPYVENNTKSKLPNESKSSYDTVYSIDHQNKDGRSSEASNIQIDLLEVQNRRHSNAAEAVPNVYCKRMINEIKVNCSVSVKTTEVAADQSDEEGTDSKSAWQRALEEARELGLRARAAFSEQDHSPPTVSNSVHNKLNSTLRTTSQSRKVSSKIPYNVYNSGASSPSILDSTDTSKENNSINGMFCYRKLLSSLSRKHSHSTMKPNLVGSEIKVVSECNSDSDEQVVSLIELPSDDAAYEELSASGYIVDKPQLRLPTQAKLFVGKDSSVHKFNVNKVVFKTLQFSNFCKESAKIPVKIKTKKPIRRERKLKNINAKVNETAADKGSPQCESRKLAQKAVDDIISTRSAAEMPAMVIVNVKGKIFMYGDT